MFAARGYLLDVGGGRLPTLKALREIVDLLARCEYNEFHLYRCGGIPSAPPDPFGEEPASIPPEEIRKLDAYCRMQGIGLVTDGGARFAWADDVLRDPAAAASLPADAILLIRGGEADHPFAGECERVKATGRAFYVCPDTSADRSLAGRVENMRENMEAAERAGRLHGARGYLVTDWSDGGHWQPFAASLPGIVMGGAFAASGAKAAKMDLELELDRVMDAPLGGLLLRLGTLYLCGGAVRRGVSELYNILAGDCGYSRHPGLTQGVLDEISGVAAGCRLAAERWTDRSDWAKEIVYMANLVDCACHRRDESRLRALRDEHGRIWRLRSRESGRIASLAKLPRF